MPGSTGPFDDGLVTEHYDVIIVGSGAGGGTLAHTLAPTGKRILLLERGDFLPREMDNWNPGAVFVDGKYISPASRKSPMPWPPAATIPSTRRAASSSTRPTVPRASASAARGATVTRAWSTPSPTP